MDAASSKATAVALKTLQVVIVILLSACAAHSLSDKTPIAPPYSWAGGCKTDKSRSTRLLNSLVISGFLPNHKVNPRTA